MGRMEMTHEDYVSFEQAKALKELGFDWETTHFYDLEEAQEGCIKGRFPQDFNVMAFVTLTSAPTLAQAAKWLREKGICVTSNINIHKGKYMYNWSITLFKEGRGVWDESVIYDTYEQALSAGIDNALELLKQQSNGN